MQLTQGIKEADNDPVPVSSDNPLTRSYLPALANRDELYKEIAPQDGSVEKVTSGGDSHHVSAYVNGMSSGHASARNAASQVMNGEEGYLIYNKKGPDPVSSFVGHMSAGFGRRIEPSVDSLANFVRENLTSVDNITLHAHSQGCIILSNALINLRKEMSETEWKTLCSKVEIHLYGTPTYNYPEGVNIISHEHEGDKVTWLTILGGFKRRDSIKVILTPNSKEHRMFGDEGYLNLTENKSEIITTQVKNQRLIQQFANTIKAGCKSAYSATKEKSIKAYKEVEKFCDRAYAKTKNVCLSAAKQFSSRTKEYFNNFFNH